MQGYIHAKDRLWQMDLSRRQPQGRLAEVLGEAALASDVQTRTIGFGRAAERSWAVIQADAAAGDKTSREAKEAWKPMQTASMRFSPPAAESAARVRRCVDYPGTPGGPWTAWPSAS